MALPRWPEELDPPLREGYAIARSENRLRRPLEQGPHRQRRKFSSVPTSVPMIIDVSRDHRARFDRFYDEQVVSGSLPFLIKDPTTHGLPIMIAGVWLLDAAGQVITMAAWQLARFGAPPPQATVIGVRYRIHFTIEVMP